MLRITEILDMSADCRATWTLRLEGTLKDAWVRELRRAWRRVREAAAGRPIRVCASACVSKCPTRLGGYTRAQGRRYGSSSAATARQ